MTDTIWYRRHCLQKKKQILGGEVNQIGCWCWYVVQLFRIWRCAVHRFLLTSHIYIICNAVHNGFVHSKFCLNQHFFTPWHFIPLIPSFKCFFIKKMTLLILAFKFLDIFIRHQDASFWNWEKTSISDKFTDNNTIEAKQ